MIPLSALLYQHLAANLDKMGFESSRGSIHIKLFCPVSRADREVLESKVWILTDVGPDAFSRSTNKVMRNFLERYFGSR